jgi:hypothetical protein
METWHMFLLGVIVSWTPSLVLLGIALWREPD